MPRQKLSSLAEIAVHEERLDNLEEGSKEHDAALGSILREISEMRTEMAGELGKIYAKLDKSPASNGNGNGHMKMGALIATITALAQVIVELAKTIIAAH